MCGGKRILKKIMEKIKMQKRKKKGVRERHQQ